MAFALQDGVMGAPGIAVTDTVQRWPEGFIQHAVDPVLGGGEFIYLKGVVGTVAGSLVTYDQIGHSTTLGPGAVANSGRPVAVAMSANVANQWGWYQIHGAAVAQKDGTALTAGAALGQGTVAGTVGAATASKQINGATVLVAASAGATTATVQLARPFCQGALT